MKHFARFLVVLSLLTLLSVVGLAQGHMYTKAAPSGPDWTSTSSAWVDIKDLSLWFYQYDAGNACVGISIEGNATLGKRMFVRALVDGVPVSPSDVVFASEGESYCRMFQFSAAISQGIHEVKFQTKVDAGGTGYFGDRTMWVITAPNLVNIVAAPSGATLTTTSSAWQDVANMSLNINVPTAGPLIVVFTGEVFSDNGKRAWLRAVVDGIAGAPSDVVIGQQLIAGVHGMTFLFPSVTAGPHTVAVQWMVDGAGTAYMGDRTVAIIAPDPNLLAAGEGGVISLSAPSGPPVTTTSAIFADIPDMTIDIPVPENGTLAITLQGEVQVSSGRMFTRATIDGNPCTPSDVGMTYQPGYFGTSSMTFLQKNVSGGVRRVKMQWQVESGQTGYFGDRNMTVAALPCAGPDLSGEFNGITPAVGTNPLLLLLWDPQRPSDPAPALGTVTELVHGITPSVADYVESTSGGKFELTNAGIFGWLAADHPASFYWAADDPTDADHDGFTSGHVRKWWEAITKADASFNYASYDENADGVLEPRELGIVIVVPQNSPFGTVRVPAAQQVPTWEPIIVDGVRIPLIAEVYAGSPLNLGVFAHELFHLLLNLPDLYFTFFFPYAAGQYSIMDASYTDAHLDPFQKIHLGWLQPDFVREPGVHYIYPTESNGEAHILMDPLRGEKEYFIVENRQRSISYDSQIADSGLAVWHVMEDPAVFGSLTAPNGVSATDWATIPPNDWGRRAIRMIRPVCGPPFDNRKALWDGSDPETGYDLLSNDSNPAHAQLRWSDGTSSGFAIKSISPATGVMSVVFELPASATGIAAGTSLPEGFALDQNYPNPFNPVTTIGYRLSGPGSSRVKLTVYDLLGREVRVVVDERQVPGSYRVTFDGKGLASGMYLYRLVAGGSVQSCKMILLR